MKKSLVLYLFIFLSQIHFSQNQFCSHLLPDPSFGSDGSPALAKGDFNNDGQVDICIQSTDAFFATTYGVGILLSTGTGTYSSFTNYSLSIHYVIQATAGDFNNDGKLDLIAVCRKDSAFYLLAGDGSGGFTSKTTYTTPSIPSLVTADFNSDGTLDIAYTCDPSPIISVMYGNATGFLSPVNYTLGSIPTLLIPGDFNNDNLPDLFALAASTSYFLQGAANGTFTIINGSNLNATHAVADDVNSDNKLDLICTDLYNNDTISIFLGNGNLTFAAPLSYPVASLSPCWLGSVASTDYDNDGKKDLIAISRLNRATTFPTDFISILPGLGNGLFSSPVVLDSLAWNLIGFNVLYNFVITDFNNDNRPDIVAMVGDVGGDPFCGMKLYQNCEGINTGLNEMGKDEMSVNLFPNPASNFMQVQVDKTIGVQYKTAVIYDDLGQPIMEKKLVFENEKATIKTGDLPNGVYTFQLNGSRNGTVNKRFVVAK